MVMNKSHLTAINRKKPSLPMRILEKQKRLSLPVLDYGSGKGYDALYYDTAMYDPHYFPYKPKRKYKTIVCNYVLNVIKKAEGNEVLRDIQEMLAEDGTAYIAVRRDVKGQNWYKKGTYQRKCTLNLPILFENRTCAIYILRKYDIIE
jgi:hypothetical protein